MIERYGLGEVGKDVLAGRVNGYYTILQYNLNENSVMFRIGASNAERADDAELVALLESLKDGKAIKKVAVEGPTIAVKGVSPLSAKTFEEKIVNFFDEVTGYLSRNGYATGSFATGLDDGTLSVVNTNDGYTYFTESEAKRLEESMIQMQIAEANKKERIFLGMIGAILGAMVGSLVYAVISILGYWAWISAVVGFALAYIGYRKFAGKIGKFGAFFSFFAGVGGIFLGILGSWAWAIFQHFKNYQPDLGFFEVLKDSLPFIFGTPELKWKFLGEVFLWGSISVVIGLFVIIGLYFDNRDRFKIKRME